MANQPPKILVPIGFSDQSILAMDDAIILAKDMKAEITLLSVLEESSLIERIFGSNKETRQEAYREAILEKLNDLAEKKSKESGIRFNTMLAHGVIYEEIARVSELIDASLVVMGTNGKPSNFKKRMIGSNAYRTVALTKAPVITTNGMRKMSKLENIIFPIVLDRKSKEKVGMALHFSRLFNARVTVVAVPQSERERKLLEQHVDQVVKFINEKGVKATGHMIETGTMEHFLEFADEKDGDLIMIMEEGEKVDIASNILGSDVQKVIYHSYLPVMSITPRHTEYRSMFNQW
jgi:nucleotide-binding universal stress UspA family protein